MKNLKKVLSLVLALAMALSLMTIAFAADANDFKDYDDVTYNEAVDVMVAAGVFNGVEGNNFAPDRVLTREEAAKIITYMLLGQDAADKLTTDKAPYADVAKDRWSAGSIAYCTEKGILAGSNGKFNPTGKLTGHAFAKMLLVALGYDANIEGYVGSSWAVNVASDAVVAGIDIEGVLLGNAVTREQAAQMAYQTLTADMVRYASKGTNIELPDGTTVVTGASDASKMPAGANDYNTGDIDSDTTNATMQFCEQYFPKLKKVTGDADGFGRPADHKWQLDNKDVFNATKTPVATFTAKTSAADVAKALNGYKLQNAAGDKTYKIENTTKYTSAGGNPTQFFTATIICANSKTANAALTVGNSAGDETTAGAIAAETANGKLIEVYADSDTKVVTAAVVVTYQTVEAGKITTDKKTGDVTYSINGSNYKDFADEDLDDTIVLDASIEKGDVVTFVVVNDVCYVYPTTSFEGTQTATKTEDGVQTITIGGKAYTVGAAKTGDFNNSKDVATYYVDQYGFVVKTDSKAIASTDYAYVIETEAKVESSALASAVVSLKAKVALADGTVAVYPVELKKNDAGDYYIKNIGADDNLIYDKDNDSLNETGEATSAAQGDIKNQVFGYTITDGTITFEKLTALPVNGTATEDNTVYVNKATDDTMGKAKQTSYTLNTDKKALIDSNTVFVAYNSTKDAAKVYTGLSALPSAVKDQTTSDDYFILKTGTTSNVGTAKVVFFTYATDNHMSADASSNYVYVDTAKYSTVMVDGKDQKQYTGYQADGTTITLVDNSASGAGIFVPDKDNKISGSQLSDSRYVDATSNKLVDAGEMIGVNGTYYYVTADTQIVYVDSDLNELNDNQAWVVLNSDNTNNVDTIYVVGD